MEFDCKLKGDLKKKLCHRFVIDSDRVFCHSVCVSRLVDKKCIIFGSTSTYLLIYQDIRLRRNFNLQVFT